MNSGAVLFCLGNVAALWLAALLSAKISRRGSEFLIGLVTIYGLIAMLSVVAGGLTSHLRREWVIPVLAILALGSAAVRSVREEVKRGCALLDWRCLKHWGVGMALALFLAFFSFPLVRMFSVGTGYFIDDFGYHTVAVASWIQHGDFRQFMPQFMAYLPVNAELLSCWFALPYENDTMVALTGLFWLLLAAGAMAGLALRAGASLMASCFAAVIIVATPSIGWQARTFSACDLAGAAALLGAMYFGGAGGANPSLGRALIAGLLAGFAAGVKATFLPVSAAICLFPLFTSGPWRMRWRTTGVLVFSAAVLGSLWYLRNALASGNPLFPAELGPFDGPLTRQEQVGIKLSGLLATVPWTPRLWGQMAVTFLKWPEAFGLLAVAGYARAIWCECRPGAAFAGEDRGLRRLLFFAGILQFALHFFAPFCLGGGYVNGVIEVYPRYVLPWFVFGLALAAPLFDVRMRLAWMFYALAGIGLTMSWQPSGIMFYVGFAVVLVAVVMFLLLPTRVWQPMLVACLPGVWPAMAVLAPTIQRATDRSFFDVPYEDGQFLGGALRALETVPPETRIARFSKDLYFNAFIYGRSWQFQPVFTDGAGVPLLPLHEEFRGNPALTFFGNTDRVAASSAELIDNLRAAGIEVVLVTRFGSSHWPAQQALLEMSGEAQAIYRNDTAALWRLSQKQNSPGSAAAQP